MPFMGEMMTCVMCGKQEKSDPMVESQWRAVQLGDGARFYACPDEFPPDVASKDDYQKAYTAFLAKVISLYNQKSSLRN